MGASSGRDGRDGREFVVGTERLILVFLVRLEAGEASGSIHGRPRGRGVRGEEISARGDSEEEVLAEELGVELELELELAEKFEGSREEADSEKDDSEESEESQSKRGMRSSSMTVNGM